MDPITLMLIGTIISGLASAGSNIYTANAQRDAQREANETNIRLANEQNAAQLQQVRETNEFNAAQAQIERDRQDTTMQRAMADYSAAGLNPLLALGSSTGSYSAPVAASGNVAKIERANVNPAYLDFSGIASAFSSMSNTMLIQAMLQGRHGDNIGYKMNALNAKVGMNQRNNMIRKAISNDWLELAKKSASSAYRRKTY